MQRPCGLPPYDAKDKRGGNGEAAGMSRGRRPAPRNVVKWDVGRPAPRPPRTFAVMRSPADCVVGGGVPDAPRRGQDPSLRCKPLKGIQRQGCGPGMPGPYGLLFPAAGVRGRLAAHNERRQFATQTRSCGCLPRRGKHCSLPSFAALNCGPGLATPQPPTQKWRKGRGR